MKGLLPFTNTRVPISHRMRTILFGAFVAGSSAAFAITGCSSDSTPSTTPDSGSASDASDAGNSDVAPACADVAGFYQVMGNCGPAGAPNAFLCATQRECAVTAHPAAETSALRSESSVPRAKLEGTISGNETTFTNGCTGTYDPVTKGGTLTCQTDATDAGCSSTFTRKEVPDGRSLCCDVTDTQHCGAGAKCTLIRTFAGGPSVTSCVSTTGALALGEPCARTGTPPFDLGHDECAAGLICANTLSAAIDQRACQRMCPGNSECGASSACYGPTNLSIPPIGICVPTCHAFGTDCPTNTACTLAPTMSATAGKPDAICLRFGPATVGDACDEATDCAPGTACRVEPGGNKCRTLCDGTHPCTTGSCSAIETTTTGEMIGTCL